MNKTVTLINPWSGSQNQTMSWKDIEDWINENIHPASIDEFLDTALKAFNADDGKVLGVMVIGG